VGKFLNGYGRDNPLEIPPGWSEWYGSVDPSTYSYVGYTLNENGVLHTYDEYSTDLYSARASDLIARLAPSRRPFFLSVAFLAPHSGGPRDPDDPGNPATPSPAPRHRDVFAAEPLPRPPSFNELDVSDKPASIQSRPLLRPARIVGLQENYQQRLESLLAVDEGVARIVSALRSSGELGRTLILFTSDNGFFHGEHRVPAGKVLVYEPSIRVPLILRGPGVPEDEHRGQPVTNADLAPTILDAAGARAGRIEDGRSLFPLLRDRGLQWGRDLFIEGGDGSRAPFDALRTYRYLYVEYATGERELYDLRTDPYQLQSLHANPLYAPLVHRLSLRLAALRGCRGRACRARPHLGVRVRPEHRCALRVLRARVVGGGRSHVERAGFYVKRRRVASDRSAPFFRRVPLRRVRRGHPFRLRVKLVTDDGRILTVDRRSRRCR
jgi:N-acetylglucosamine-6-sulfatase